MNDSTQYIEDKEPKRKSKLPVILLIAAVLLGLVIWIFKNTGSKSETAVVAQDTISKAAPVAEPAKPDTTPAPAMPAASAPVPKPEKVVSTPVEKPVHKAAHHKALPEEPRIVSSERQGDLKIVGGSKTDKEESKVAAPKPEPKPEKSAPSAVEQPKAAASAPVAPKEEMAVSTPKPAPKPVEAPVIASPKPASTPVVATKAPVASTEPAKKFVPEDEPMPEKAPLSEEGKLAMNTVPKAAEAPGDAVAASSDASDVFKQGMDAYHKQDYAGAIEAFGKLPKPTTKQRGNPVRDQYVQGNFLLGLSLLRVERTSDAVNAFLTVLDYEKYYPLANMNLGICYVELRQYFKANKTFEAVIRDQGYIDASIYDDVMQRSKYFWALAWTRMYKTAKDPNKQAYYQQQAVLRWKDYQTWFGKNTKYRAENRRAEDYLKSLSAM